jgi:hypothetical protein
MNNVQERIQTIKLELNKKLSFALLSGAVVLQSPELIKSWANSQIGGEPQVYENGNTALHIAVQNSWVEAAEILLKNGISPARINYEDLSAITLARNIYHEYANKIIVSDSYAGKTALDEETTAKFVQAKQVLDVFDKYKYADNI